MNNNNKKNWYKFSNKSTSKSVGLRTEYSNVINKSKLKINNYTKNTITNLTTKRSNAIITNRSNFFNQKIFNNLEKLRQKTKNKNINFHLKKFNSFKKNKKIYNIQNLEEIKNYFKNLKNIKNNNLKNKKDLDKQIEELKKIKKDKEENQLFNYKVDNQIKSIDYLLNNISKNNEVYMWYNEPYIKNTSIFNSIKHYLDSYNNMLSKIRYNYNEVMLHFKKLNQKKNNYFDFYDSKLSKDELNIVKFEYQKKKFKESYDLNKLYEILKKLYFFKKISKEYALIFIQKSDIMFLNKDKFLFKKGDIADDMYVIIYGTVTVCFDYYLNSLGYNFKNTITQLDDGYDFGNLIALSKKQDEVSLIKRLNIALDDIKNKLIILRRVSLETDLVKKNLFKMKNILDLRFLTNVLKTYNFFRDEKLNDEIINEIDKVRKRVADIFATENTFIIKINNEVYKNYILKPYESENNEKLNLICKIPIFNNISKVLLISLIQILKKRIFKLGEIILLEDKFSDIIFFINKGIIDVVIKKFDKIILKKKSYEKKNFNFSKEAKKRVKINKKKFKKKNQNYIESNIIVKSLNKFNFFGEMCLLNKNTFPQKLLHLKKPELYTYIANTAEVEIYYFHSYEFNLLTKPVQNAFKNYLMEFNYDLEFQYKEGILVKNETWKNYSQNFIKDELKFLNNIKNNKFN